MTMNITWEAPAPQNYTAPAHSPTDYSEAGSTSIILYSIAAWFSFGIICCLWRSMLNYINPPPPPPPQLQRTTIPERVEDKATRLMFINANLPCRKIDLSDDSGNEETGDALSKDLRLQEVDDILLGSQRSLNNTNCIPRIGSNDTLVEMESNTSSPRRPSLESQESSYRMPVCSICLNPYQKGDEVSWSTNATCPHEYHRDCIQNWLVLHDDCPMCRNIFLLKPETAQAGMPLDALPIGESVISPPDGGSQVSHVQQDGVENQSPSQVLMHLLTQLIRTRSRTRGP